MMKSKQIKFFIFILSLLLTFSIALPAKAFYLEVPNFFSTAMQMLKTSNSQAQEGPVLERPPHPSLPQPNPDSSGSFYCNSLGRTGTTAECDAADSAMKSEVRSPEQYIQDMNGQQPRPMMMPGPNPNMNQDNGQNMGPDNRQNDDRYIKDMQRGAKQMERQVKQLETQIQKAEKSGTTIDASLKDKVNQVKTMIDCVRNASDNAASQLCNADEMGNLMQDLEEQRRDVIEAAQRLQQMKKEIKKVESNLKMFEKQLAKAGTCVSAEVKEKLASLKQTVETIKNAKTWAEVEEAGFNDMGELFMGLDENRQVLELCSRWPQVQKQVNKEITNLDRQLKKSKTTVTRLAAKGIDLSSTYSTFESAVAKLKTTRDEAKAMMESGDAEGAMDLLENEVFGQMEDIWQNQKIIDMMNNLGRFNSDFKRETARADKDIRALAKKKIDVTELKDILAEVKAKGSEVLAAMKTVKDDPDTVLSLIEELEDLGMNFDAKKAELTGEEVNMPWEQGPQQFNKIEMPSTLNQYIKKDVMQPGGVNPVGESNPQPSPSPQSMCMPPDCTE